MAYKTKITGPIKTSANTYGFGSTANSSSEFTFQFSAWIKFKKLGVVIAQGNHSSYGWTFEITTDGYLKLTTKYNGNSSIGYSYHKFKAGVMYNLRMRSSNRAGMTLANRLYYKFTDDGTATDLPNAEDYGTMFRTAGGGSSGRVFNYTSYSINQTTTIDPSSNIEFRGNVQLVTTDGKGTARAVAFATNSLALGEKINQSITASNGSSNVTVTFKSTYGAENNCMAKLIDSEGNSAYKCCYLIDSSGNKYERDKLSGRYKVIST